MEAGLEVGKAAGGSGGVGHFEVKSSKSKVKSENSGARSQEPGAGSQSSEFDGRAMQVVMVVGGVSRVVGQEVAAKVKESLAGGEGLKKVMERVKEGLGGGRLVVGVWEGEKLRVASIGGQGYLERGGRWMKLTKGGEELSLVMGRWEEGDRVVLATEEIEISGGESGEKMTERLQKEVGEGAAAIIKVKNCESRIMNKEEGVSKAAVPSGVLAGEVVGTGDERKVAEGKRGKRIQIRVKEVGAGLAGGLVSGGKGLVGGLKGGVGGMAGWLVRRLPGEEQVYVMDQRRVKRGRKLALAVGTVALVALVVSVVWGLKERKRQELEARWQKIADEVNYRIEEGKVLAELNPSRARVLLEEAKGLLKGAEGEEGMQGKTAALSGKLNKVLGVALGEHEAEGKLWFDMTLLGEGVEGDDWAVSDGKLVILDAKGGRVVRVEMESKAAEIGWGGDQVKGAKGIAAGGGKDYVVNNKGVADKNGLVIDKDPEWGEIGGIAAYGGNVYLLDKSMGAIWRYPAVEGGGFGSKQEWLAQPLDLTGAEGMVIDGAIWVVEPQDVRRMMMGVEEGFKVKNLQEAPGKLTGMYTSGDLANLYLLDQGGKRVIVADKESGEYKEQYQWDKIGEAKKIAVDEKESKILLLMGKEIYEIGIK